MIILFMVRISFFPLFVIAAADNFVKRTVYDDPACKNPSVLETVSPMECTNLGVTSMKLGCTEPGASNVTRLAFPNSDTCLNNAEPSFIPTGQCVPSYETGFYEILSCPAEIVVDTSDRTSAADLSVYKYKHYACEGATSATPSIFPVNDCTASFITSDYATYYCTDNHVRVYTYNDSLCSTAVNRSYVLSRGCARVLPRLSFRIDCSSSWQSNETILGIGIFGCVVGVCTVFAVFITFFISNRRGRLASDYYSA